MDEANLIGKEDKGAKRSALKRTLKVTLFRAWAAGAVCFLGAWGRSGSEEAGTAFSLNLIIGLIAIMVIFDLVIVNPVIRMASGRRAFADGEKKGWRLFLGGPFHIAKIMVLMLLIVGTYYMLNVFFIRVLDMDAQSVPVPLEPFLFGILYGLYYLIFDIVGTLFHKEKP